MKPLLGRGARAPLAALLALGAALAAGLASLPAAAAPDTDARAWLLRLRQAASSVNYQGTMVVSAGGAVSSSRVWHYCVGDQRYERLEAQDGQQQSVYRHNDEVRTLWPQSRVAVAERREALASWPALPGALDSLDARVLESYELRHEGQARVAGRDATVFMLAPRDALRFAQRLWADAASGLMLRADVLGPGRQVLESTAFSEVEIGVKPQPEAVLQTMRRLDAAAGEGRNGWQVLRPLQRRTQLEAEGWTLRQPVPGFALAGCALRTLAHATTDAQPVLQAVFSDGLTHVSLFIEPFRPERHRVEGVQQLGATGTVVRRHGEHWITAVGDVPAATLLQLTGALERRR